jgi:CheY-like chemotaxis protein
LHVETTLGRGSAFQLFFPASAAVELLPPTRPATESSPIGHILVIDDEESVRMAVADILDMEGLRVLAAADGADGIALYAQWQTEVSLIILDLSMPGLSGEETLARLRRLDPTVPIILSSGYSQREAIRRFAGQTVSGFLQKPYDAEALIVEVRKHHR